MEIFDIVDTFITNLFRTIVIWRFMLVLFGAETENKKIELLSYMSFYATTCLAYLLFHFPPVTIAVNLGSLFWITCQYGSRLKKKLLVTLLTYGLNMSCDFIAVYSVSDYEIGGEVHLVATYLSSILFALCITLVSRIIIHKERGSDRTPYWQLLVLIPVISILLLFLFMGSDVGNRGLLVALSASILVINITTFYLYYSLTDTYQTIQNQSLMNRQLRSYKNQLEVLKESEEKVSSLRHDMKHHLVELQAMAAQAEDEAVLKYLSKMWTSMENDTEYVRSGNYEADSLLNYLIHKAMQKKCHVTYKVCIPTKIEIDSFDFNVVIGNLLENAIEASEQSEEKELSVDIKYDKGILLLRIENSFSAPLKKRGSDYLSTKREKGIHGIGLKNVRRIVDSYQGILETEEKNNHFIVSVIMYEK